MSYWVLPAPGQSLARRAGRRRAVRAPCGRPRTAPTRCASFAAEADADPASVRWSYRRDFGRVRLLMVDTRAARVLDEEQPRDAGHGRGATGCASRRWTGRGVVRPSADRHLAALAAAAPHPRRGGWNAALCRGRARRALGPVRGGSAAARPTWSTGRPSPSSFAALAELIAEAGCGPGGAGDGLCAVGGRAPRVRGRAALAGAGRSPDARVLQLTCSPVHNSIPALDTGRLPLRLEPAGPRARAAASPGTAGVTRPPVSWRRTGGPWFGNQLMTLTLRGPFGAAAAGPGPPGDERRPAHGW